MTTNLFESLFKDTKIVAYARFNKARRLSKRTWWSLFSISTLSIVLILLTIFEQTNSVRTVHPFFIPEISIKNWIFTVVTSLITLTLSISLAAARLDVEVEKLNDSAIRINKISREIEAHKSRSSYDDYLRLVKEYNDVILDNRVNHDTVDFIIAKCSLNTNKDYHYYFNKYVFQHIQLIHYYLITAISLSAATSILSNVFDK